jgi:phage repressor protein C with HTH and peptisase S24 domain
LKDFGARVGVTATSVQRWESGKAEISELIARALEQAFTIRYEWILTGEGPMWVSGKDAGPEDLVYLPVIAGAAACGRGGEIADPGPGATTMPFRREFLQQLLRDVGGGGLEDLFLVECQGESMRPTILPGDLAIVSTTLALRLKPKRDGLYLVRLDPNSTDGKVKRIRQEGGHLWFLSDAQGFAPLSVEVDGVPMQSLVLGRVCWISRSVLKEDSIEMAW